MEKARGCKETGDRWKERRKECYHTGTMTLRYTTAKQYGLNAMEARQQGGERKGRRSKMELQVGNLSVMDQNRYWLLVEIHREHGGCKAGIKCREYGMG